MATIHPKLTPPPPPPPNPNPTTNANPPNHPPPEQIVQSQFAYPRTRTDIADGKHERVAESFYPSHAVIDIDSDGDEEDGGCSSCVDGGECRGGQEEESCFLSKNVSGATKDGDERHRHDEDLKWKIRRQEEDRKFWEACLTSGYP